MAEKTESGVIGGGQNPWIARPNQQEQFSDAFLLAIAAGAGCAVSRPEPDHDSIDWTLSCRLPRRPKIDIQLKSTSAGAGTEREIRYRLKAKNYLDLSLPDLVVPRLLVLVVVPENVEDWLYFSPRSLILHKAAYWLSLAGGQKLSNTKSFMVSIPASNLFTSEVLRDFMKRVEAGEPL